MHDSVDHIRVNPAELARQARVDGARIRGRRRVALVLGSAAVVAVVAVSAGLLARPGDPGDARVAVDPGVTTEPTTTTAQTPDADVPAGRRAAAYLAQLLTADALGRTSHYAGQGVADGDVFAQLRLTPPGEGFGIVDVNIQRLSMFAADDLTRDCSAAWMTACALRKLPDGAFVRTYETDHTPSPDGEWWRSVAEFQDPASDLRVIVAATNGLDLPENRVTVTRPAPVLTRAELISIAQAPGWAPGGAAVPVDPGSIAPFTDLDAQP